MDAVGVKKDSVGCEVCKPAIGSILASLWNEHVMNPAHHAYVPNFSPTPRKIRVDSDFTETKIQTIGSWPISRETVRRKRVKFGPITKLFLKRDFLGDSTYRSGRGSSFVLLSDRLLILGPQITPDKLLVLAQVAKKCTHPSASVYPRPLTIRRTDGLYTKITGGQRIDLFGAQKADLPSIWKELVDVGFESGHGYGVCSPTLSQLHVLKRMVVQGRLCVP